MLLVKESGARETTADHSWRASERDTLSIATYRKMLCPYSGYISEGINFRGFELRLFAVEVSRMLHGVSVAVLGKGSDYTRLARVHAQLVCATPTAFEDEFLVGYSFAGDYQSSKSANVYTLEIYPLYGIICTYVKNTMRMLTILREVWTLVHHLREACLLFASAITKRSLLHTSKRQKRMHIK